VICAGEKQDDNRSDIVKISIVSPETQNNGRYFHVFGIPETWKLFYEVGLGGQKQRRLP